MNSAYRIATETFGTQVVQTVDFDDGLITTNLMRMVADTAAAQFDAKFRELLIQQGWTPPKDEDHHGQAG